MWLSCLCLPLHSFSFSLYIFSCVDFYKCFFVPCGFTVFVELYIYVIIVPLSIWVAVKTSTIFMPLSAVCAIIERINPTWVCVVLFDRIYLNTSIPPQDKGLYSCTFICINSNYMFSAVWGGGGCMVERAAREPNCFIVLSYLGPKDFNWHCYYRLW